MIKIPIYKENAEKYKELLIELRPNVNVSFCDGDVNLYYLGFIDYFPCYIVIDMSDSEMIDLLEELFDMEISAYNYDDKILYSSCSKLNDEERKIKKQAEENMKKYTKFAPLYGLCEKYYNLKNE